MNTQKPDEGPYKDLPLILSSEQLAKVAGVKNARAATRWARAKNLKAIGRNRWSKPAALKVVEREAFAHVCL